MMDYTENEKLALVAKIADGTIFIEEGVANSFHVSQAIECGLGQELKDLLAKEKAKLLERIGVEHETALDRYVKQVEVHNSGQALFGLHQSFQRQRETREAVFEEDMANRDFVHSFCYVNHRELYKVMRSIGHPSHHTDKSEDTFWAAAKILRNPDDPEHEKLKVALTAKKRR